MGMNDNGSVARGYSRATRRRRPSDSGVSAECPVWWYKSPRGTPDQSQERFSVVACVREPQRVNSTGTLEGARERQGVRGDNGTHRLGCRPFSEQQTPRRRNLRCPGKVTTSRGAMSILS